MYWWAHLWVSNLIQMEKHLELKKYQANGAISESIIMGWFFFFPWVQYFCKNCKQCKVMYKYWIAYVFYQVVRVVFINRL